MPETQVPVPMEAGDEDLYRLLIARLEECEPYHKQWVERAKHFYGLYRSYRHEQDAYRQADPPGRDEIRNDAAATWGTELFIPMSFRTVEAVVPRVVAQRPRMLAKPRPGFMGSEVNIDNVEFMLDVQQEQIDYELKLQSLIKTACFYGLCVQKVTWRTEYARRRRVVASRAPRSANPTGLAVVDREEPVFDDPDAEAKDPLDWLWDPFATDMGDLGYCFDRRWRTTDYCLEMLASGQWKLLLGPNDNSTAEELLHADSRQKYDETFRWREEISGFSKTPEVAGPDGLRRGVHEVLEFHDGEKVVTMVDRRLIVQRGENPYWHGEVPFQIHRPTELPNQLPGIGEIEPIEQLQEEINMLRSDRRDNARLVLQKVFAYWEGQLDVDNLRFGPGIAIGTYTDPKDVLFPIQTGDIPYSGFEEEDRLMGNFDAVSGMNDLMTGGSGIGGDTTATEAQIGAAAMDARIRLKARRAEIELMKHGASQMMALNQQKILTNRMIPYEVPPTPGQPDRRWAWRRIGPMELAGEFAFEPEGGSAQADNPVEQREKGQFLLATYKDDPNVDQRWLREEVARLYGVKVKLAPPNPTLPPEILDHIADAAIDSGMDPTAIQAIIAQATQEFLPEIRASSSLNASAAPALPPPGE